MPHEIWRDIPGTESRYQASDLGRIRCMVTRGKWKAGRVLSQRRHSRTHAYLVAKIALRGGRIRGWKVHQLVMAAFHGWPPPGLQVNHLNGEKLDNRLENLEYCTARENIRHAIRTGL